MVVLFFTANKLFSFLDFFANKVLLKMLYKTSYDFIPTSYLDANLESG